MRQLVSLFVVMLGLSVGCAEDERAARYAGATIAGKGAMPLAGNVSFHEEGNGLKVTVMLTNAPPGKHGVHVHESGSCADNEAGVAGGAGAHFNPSMKEHGEPGGKAHAGDLGNITVMANGRGELTLNTRYLTIGEGTANVVGKAIVVHAMEDDEMTQPSGDSGARIGCGVIQ